MRETAHAEGYATWAVGRASHAGGKYTHAIHDRSFIHAAGTAQTPKLTQYPDTAHFDKLYTFETWGEDAPENAVLSIQEADQRYGRADHIPPQGIVPMGCYTNQP